MGRERRARDAAAAGRPSDVSRDRLARRMRAEVADVRVRLEEAVLRSDALMATGQPERAAAVLDEQHALLAELQETIASAVAAASVEAEAEAVLFGSPSDVPAPAHGGGSAQRGEAPAVPAPRRVRATASAVASAVAVLALLVLGAPTPSPTTMPTVDSDDVADERSDDTTDVGSGGAGPAGDASEVAADGRPIGPNEREVRRLFTSPAPSPRGDDVGVATGLSELQQLVDQFVASVVRAAGGLASSDAPVGTDELERRRSRASDDEGSPAVRRQPAEAEPASSPDRAADARDADAGTGRADDRAEAGDEGDDEAPGLPLPSEDGNAAHPGVPGLPE